MQYRSNAAVYWKKNNNRKSLTPPFVVYISLAKGSCIDETTHVRLICLKIRILDWLKHV